jgi:hypothetical protein
MCQEACVTDPRGLPEAIRRSEDRLDFDAKLQQCESNLQLQGGMADLEALCRLVFEAATQHLDYDKERGPLEQQLSEYKLHLKEVNKQIGAVEEALRGLRARPRVGELVPQEESEFARLRDLR